MFCVTWFLLFGRSKFKSVFEFLFEYFTQTTRLQTHPSTVSFLCTATVPPADRIWMDFFVCLSSLILRLADVAVAA